MSPTIDTTRGATRRDDIRELAIAAVAEINTESLRSIRYEEFAVFMDDVRDAMESRLACLH